MAFYLTILVLSIDLKYLNCIIHENNDLIKDGNYFVRVAREGSEKSNIGPMQGQAFHNKSQ